MNVSKCPPFSFPESAFLLVSTKNTDSGHFQGRKSANHGLPARLRTRSEIWNNSGCQWLQKWTCTTTAHNREVTRVRVLGADQKKSGLWRRDWVPPYFSSRVNDSPCKPRNSYKNLKNKTKQTLALTTLCSIHCWGKDFKGHPVTLVTTGVHLIRCNLGHNLVPRVSLLCLLCRQQQRRQRRETLGTRLSWA